MTPSLWERPALPLWAWLAWPASAGYGLGQAVHRLAYDQGWARAHRLPVPVVSVGNLTVGGTGKTPVVLALAEGLCARGLRVGVLSRGYGAREPRQSVRATDPAWGDEAALIQAALPDVWVVVGRDRVASGRWLLSQTPIDVILLDDGFQHRRLHRDLDIVLVDGRRGLGNGQLLPLGPLREPVSSLARADALWVTKVPPEAANAALARIDAQLPGRRPAQLPLQAVPTVFTGLTPLGGGDAPEPLSRLAGQPLVTVSGLADPAGFEQALRDLGATLVETARFPDHHVYTVWDLHQMLANRDRWPAKTQIVTTAKDAVKLHAIWPSGLSGWVLTQAAQVPTDAVWAALVERVPKIAEIG